MTILKKLRKCFLFAIIFCVFLSVMPPVETTAAADIIPRPSYNLSNYLRHKSFLTVSDNGYMRLFYDGEQIVIEYYDESFNIQSRKLLEMELDIWGGFYEGSDAYYIIEGCTNTDENDNAEVVRVIKYDKEWNRQGAANITPNADLWGAEVRYPFDYGCVEAAEYNGKLYIVTGHEGYVDPTYNQGHQGFLMIAVDEATMEGKIVVADLWHSFAQYIDNIDSDFFVLEQSEGSRCTKLSKYSTDDSGDILKINSFPVLEYGGSRTSAWAIACRASVDGIALSDKNVLCLGTSIDQSDYDNYSSDTSYNIYLTVTSMTDFSEEATTVKWITDYNGDGKRFHGTKITKISDERFMISWEEYTDEDLSPSDINDGLSAHILHYIFIDGDGNKLSEEFTVNAPFSDCQPVLNGSKVVYCASNSIMVDFYSIDVNTGEFSKKVHRSIGENAVWNIDNSTLTISGTGEINSDTSVSGWEAIRDSVEKIVIKSGITSIAENQFKYFSNLKEVYIEDGLKSIGKEAFACCDNLADIFIPSSVTEIGDDFLWTGYFWVSDYSHVVDATIHAPLDSYAVQYAIENDIRFESDSDIITIQGDISGNGKIDLYDAIEICKSIMGMKTFTDEEKLIADYDGNGVIDLYDAIGIAQKLLEK